MAPCTEPVPRNHDIDIKRTSKSLIQVGRAVPQCTTVRRSALDAEKQGRLNIFVGFAPSLVTC